MNLPYQIHDAGYHKLFRSPIYNYDFNKHNGHFARWGCTKEHDAEYGYYGPEIADIETSVGSCSGGCRWCYKNNTDAPGQHMDVGTFSHILRNLGDTLTQVALGITDLDANPDLVEIMQASRMYGIIPNLTMTGLGASQDRLKKVAELAGAVAVSVYPHTRDIAYRTIGMLMAYGLEQVNIHLLYHADNVDFVRSVLYDVKHHLARGGLNAVVLLGLKPKGRGEGIEPLPYIDFADLVDYAVGLGVPLGFDSCSAPKFERWADESYIGSDEERRQLMELVEPCESCLFSVYVDVNGNAWPCSFSEGRDGITPISLLENDFKDVWYSQPFNEFRAILLNNDRMCPLYDID